MEDTFHFAKWVYQYLYGAQLIDKLCDDPSFNPWLKEIQDRMNEAEKQAIAIANEVKMMEQQKNEAQLAEQMEQEIVENNNNDKNENNNENNDNNDSEMQLNSDNDNNDNNNNNNNNEEQSPEPGQRPNDDPMEIEGEGGLMGKSNHFVFIFFYFFYVCFLCVFYVFFNIFLCVFYGQTTNFCLKEI